MTTVVGLDLSLTASGLARLSWSGSQYTVDTWKRGEDGVTLLPLADRYRAIVHLAADVLAYAEPCDLVVVEGPSLSSRSTSSVERDWLWTRVVGRLIDHGQRFTVVQPSARSKWATGNGRSGKVAVAVEAGRIWTEVAIRDDNIADALVLAGIGMQLLDGPCPFTVTKARREVATKLEIVEEVA